MTTTLRRATRLTQCVALLAFALVISLALVSAPVAGAKGGNGNDGGPPAHAGAGNEDVAKKPARTPAKQPAGTTANKPAKKPAGTTANKPVKKPANKRAAASTKSSASATAAKTKPRKGASKRTGSPHAAALAISGDCLSFSLVGPPAVSNYTVVFADGSSTGKVDTGSGDESFSLSFDQAIAFVQAKAGTQILTASCELGSSPDGSAPGAPSPDAPATGSGTPGDAKATSEAPGCIEVTSTIARLLAFLGVDAGDLLLKACGDQPRITICHATGSATNPFVEITISLNGLNGHGDHEGDIIPMPADGCPEGTAPGAGAGTPDEEQPDERDTDAPADKDDTRKDETDKSNAAGKVTLCHATGSATNPFVEITISENGLNGHGDHEGDIIPMPADGCPEGTAPAGGATPPAEGPTTTPGDETTPPPAGDTTPPPGDEGAPPAGDTQAPSAGAADTPTPTEGAAPATEGDTAGGGSPAETGEAVAGASDTPNDEDLTAGEAVGGDSPALPFTGLALGLLIAMGIVAAGAGVATRRAARAKRPAGS